MKELNKLVELSSKADDEVTWAILPFDLTKDGWCPEVVNYIAAMSPHAIKSISEAFRALEQRAEAAEAEVRKLLKNIYEEKSVAFRVVEERDALRDKLAGLEKQEPIGWQYRYNDGHLVGDWKTVDSESECNASNLYERRKIFTHPAPAFSLSELVPGEVTASDAECSLTMSEAESWAAGVNWVIACIISKIEKHK